MKELIAREREMEILGKLYRSKKAQFSAIYGRRRVGKTFLVTQFFRDKGVYFEGQHHQTPKGWQEAFTLLRRKVEAVDSPQ